MQWLPHQPDKCHPTIEADLFIYPGATSVGGSTIIVQRRDHRRQRLDHPVRRAKYDYDAEDASERGTLRHRTFKIATRAGGSTHPKLAAKMQVFRLGERLHYVSPPDSHPQLGIAATRIGYCHTFRPRPRLPSPGI